MTSLNQGLSDYEIILLNRFLIKANADAKHQKDICWLDGYLCARFLETDTAKRMV